LNCKHFGLCGSCTLGNLTYNEQLEKKIDEIKSLFNANAEIFASLESAFRFKAEFKIYKDDTGLSYAMRADKSYIKIDKCEIVSLGIQNIMSILLNEVQKTQILKEKLFEAHFLDGDKILITLIYHKKLDANFEIAANELAQKLNINIVCRSKGQKIVINNDFIDTNLIGFKYRFSENGFSQPNRYINEKMLSWAVDATKNIGGDLLEAYCGSGNFTIALAKNFNKVFATEISTPTIALAEHNAKTNNINNIQFARLSGEELASAINRDREFFRLKDINLDSFDFKAIVVDPPRAGLDDAARKFCTKWDTIIYISCSPQTLRRDLDEIEKTHSIEKLAFFDQFPFTNHLECGVVLKKR
jgi:tRNA (uracil-5-)-methyltransferase